VTARGTADGLLPPELPLAPDERLLAEFRADPRAYWRAHLLMAAGLGVLAGLALLLAGNPFPWTGPVAAVLAVGARAAFLRSDMLADRWRLTDRRLLGPGGRAIPLGQIAQARPFLGDVQIVTRSGEKHLMKYLADAPSVLAALAGARP
jgi:hypothetical protein